MNEKWLLYTNAGDIESESKRLVINKGLLKLLWNRGITNDDLINKYFSTEPLYKNYAGIADIDKAADTLYSSIINKEHIRIIGDYDIDGVFSTYILEHGLLDCGATVSCALPDRILDGYGLNDRLILYAADDKVDLIITCDNGIAAIEPIELAYKNNMKVIVTDHHEVPLTISETDERFYDIPKCEATVDIKRPDDQYGFTEICGAVVAWKVIMALHERFNIAEEVTMKYLPYAAFATIGDVMPLIGENRAIVKEGLEMLGNVDNYGILALLMATNLTNKKLTPSNVGFTLGPCINAAGRLDSATLALELLDSTSMAQAQGIAQRLVELNTQRKELTTTQVEEANIKLNNEYLDDNVIVIYLPECRESLAGIVAGKIVEKTGKPSIVLTDGTSCLKGSGRSIPEYNMYEELCKVDNYLVSYGGHAQGCGLQLKLEDLDLFRAALNKNVTIHPSELCAKVKIDDCLDFNTINLQFAYDIQKLEPFGNGNPEPLFVTRDVELCDNRLVGKSKNVLQGNLKDSTGTLLPFVMFNEALEFKNYIESKGKVQIVYNIQINTYNGVDKIQLVIQKYR